MKQQSPSRTLAYRLITLVASIQVTASFVHVPPCARNNAAPPLFGYRNELGEGGSRGGGDIADYGNEAMLQRPQERGLTIPIVQSNPQSLPLMMGAEKMLDPPTRGQWQALEESVTLHKNYLVGSNLTAIDAAPLVAVMDDYTGAVERPGYVYIYIWVCVCLCVHSV